MARKTISIDTVKDLVNSMIASSTGTPAHRNGMQAVLESILLSTGNYHGFCYLTVNDVPDGAAPGINISPIDGQHLEDYDQLFANTDRSRVRYY